MHESFFDVVNDRKNAKKITLKEKAFFTIYFNEKNLRIR